MYGIFTYIWLICMVNVGKCTIHGSYVNLIPQNIGPIVWPQHTTVHPHLSGEWWKAFSGVFHQAGRDFDGSTDPACFFQEQLGQNTWDLLCLKNLLENDVIILYLCKNELDLDSLKWFKFYHYKINISCQSISKWCGHMNDIELINWQTSNTSTILHPLLLRLPIRIWRQASSARTKSLARASKQDAETQWNPISPPN